MSIKNRLLTYLDYLEMGQNAFEKKVGISNGYISHNKGSFGSSIIQKIAQQCPDLNMDWLLYGNGEMLKSRLTDEQDAEIVYVPLLPIYAQGGSLNDFIVSVKGSDCERVVSPIRGADFAITVSGESMFPEYPSGSQILIKKINERAFIDWGKTYVLDTCNGTVVKRIVPSDRDGYIRCVSINPAPEFAPFEISLEDIYGIYRVMMCMAVK